MRLLLVIFSLLMASPSTEVDLDMDEYLYGLSLIHI